MRRIVTLRASRRESAWGGAGRARGETARTRTSKGGSAVVATGTSCRCFATECRHRGVGKQRQAWGALPLYESARRVQAPDRRPAARDVHPHATRCGPRRARIQRPEADICRWYVAQRQAPTPRLPRLFVASIRIAPRKSECAGVAICFADGTRCLATTHIRRSSEECSLAVQESLSLEMSYIDLAPDEGRGECSRC